MQAKIHLLIISAIIVVIFLIWYVMYGNVEKKAPIVVSAYTIEIVRSNYGLDCAKIMDNLSLVDPNNNKKKQIFKENNVLEKVSELCNGKQTCDLVITDKNLNFEVGKSCVSKILEVEYRCFQVDRLRKISDYEGNTLNIDCKHI